MPWAERLEDYRAAQALIAAAQARGLTGSSSASAYAALPSIPYWENLFPGAAGGGLTATQAIAQLYMSYAPDWISALYDLDRYGSDLDLGGPSISLGIEVRR